MIRFDSDYMEGAHPAVMEALVRNNTVQTPGYGEDIFCERAAALIRERCAMPGAAVHFLVGGTQTNRTVIVSLLRPHQGVVSADSGHIAVHETGAIENGGHKVLPLPPKEGKISGCDVEALCRAHFSDASFEHMVQPGMVYISNPTEIGTVYTRAELQELYAACRERGPPLYIDGARLGCALVSSVCDYTLAEMARLCDVFTIGGTKLGALFGEAVVFTDPSLARDFRYFIKQNGGMLAKGRLLGIQFETLFTDGLYTRIAQNAVDLAMVLRDALQKKGVPFLYESPTNQQFPILPDAVVNELSDRYAFEGWGRVDDSHTATRICMSWATPKENVDALLRDLLPLL